MGEETVLGLVTTFRIPLARTSPAFAGQALAGTKGSKLKSVVFSFSPCGAAHFLWASLLRGQPNYLSFMGKEGLREKGERFLKALAYTFCPAVLAGTKGSKLKSVVFSFSPCGAAHFLWASLLRGQPNYLSFIGERGFKGERGKIFKIFPLSPFIHASKNSAFLVGFYG